MHTSGHLMNVRLLVWVCVAGDSLCGRLPQPEELIHFSHASLGNAGSLIKDWVFHGGFGILPATCSLSLSLFPSPIIILALSFSLSLSFFPFTRHLLPRSVSISFYYSISILTRSYYPSFIPFFFCLAVSLTYTHTHFLPFLLLTHCLFHCLCAHMLSCQLTGGTETCAARLLNMNCVYWICRCDTNSTVTNEEQVSPADQKHKNINTSW